MRNNIAIVLVLCGTILALAPEVSDFMQGWRMAQAMSEPVSATASGFFRQPLEQSYRIGTWNLGGTLVGFGIVFGAARAWSISNNQ